MMNIFRTVGIITASVAAIVSCSCQQKKTYPVLFLAQESRDDPSGYTSGKHFYYFQGRAYTRMPVMTLNHFASFRSELDPTDGSYGITLYAKPEYRMHLYTHTLEKRGLLMLPVVNGLAMEPMRIEPVTDGILKIWNGLNGYDLKMIAKTVKPINPEIEEKRYLDEDPRPRPKLPKGAKPRRDFTGLPVGEIFN